MRLATQSKLNNAIKATLFQSPYVLKSMEFLQTLVSNVKTRNQIQIAKAYVQKITSSSRYQISFATIFMNNQLIALIRLIGIEMSFIFIMIKKKVLTYLKVIQGYKKTF